MSSICGDAGADQGRGFRYPSLCRRFRRCQAGCPSGQRERSVKPSAQPTLVRTQHLPPHISPAQAVCGQIIAAGCRGCEPIWAGARASSGGAVFGQVRALRPDPVGICGPRALLGAVEWWLSRDRAAALTGEAGTWSVSWPAGSLRCAAGTWTPAGAGYSIAPLTVPGRLPQATGRPAAAAGGSSASRSPAGMMHGDGYRRDRREGTGVVLAGLDPVSTASGKPTVISAPGKSSSPGRPKSSATPSSPARGRHIRSASSSCTAVTSAPVARHGLQLKLRSKRTDDDRHGHPADGVVCTHAARFRACCTIHWPPGWAVALRIRIRRVACSIAAST